MFLYYLYNLIELCYLKQEQLISVKVFYDFLSPYLNIVFALWMSYLIFLRKFFKQRKNARLLQISNQKDQLNKEVFDQVSQRIEDVYVILGDVQKYHTFFFDLYEKQYFDILKNHLEKFRNLNEDLYEKLRLLSLICERYDFLIQERTKDGTSILGLAGDLYVTAGNLELTIQSIINKEKIDAVDFKAELQKIFEECSLINRHVNGILKQLKSIVKNLFESLNEMEKSFKN